MDGSIELVRSQSVSKGVRVWHLSWSPKGSHLSTCGEDKILRVWNLVTNKDAVLLKCVATLEDAQERTLRSCEWSPDGRMLACASFDGTVVVWEARGGAEGGNLTHWDQIATLEGHENEVKSVTWSADGRWLATCGRDKRVWIWEKLSRIGNEFECVSMLQGHTQDVKFVRWHPIESVLFSASYDDSIKLWSEDGSGSGDDEFYCTATLTGHGSTVWGLAIDPLNEGRRMVSCSADQSIILWLCNGPVTGDDKTRGVWRPTHAIAGMHSTFPVYSLDWSAEHNLILSGGGDNGLALCRIKSDETGGLAGLADGGASLALELVCVQPNAHLGDVNCARWRPSEAEEGGALLASAGDDGIIKIWAFRYL